MPLTLTVPPTIAHDVQMYASKRGTTITALLLEYLAQTASSERKSHKSENPVMRFCGVLPKGAAEKMMAVVSEQRTIDESLWK